LKKVGYITSIEKYTDNQVQVSKLAKAMGHPARIAILEKLSVGDCTCNDIVDSLPLSQSTLSQHLKELRNAELIEGLEMPPKTIYSLNMVNYTNFKNILNDIF
jgi:DNA-binding transcriptional ArsR family regulator